MDKQKPIILHTDIPDREPLHFHPRDFRQAEAAALFRIVTRTGEPATVDAAFETPQFYLVITSAGEWMRIETASVMKGRAGEGTELVNVSLFPVKHAAQEPDMARAALEATHARVVQAIGATGGMLLQSVGETDLFPDVSWTHLAGMLRMLAHLEAAADIAEAMHAGPPVVGVEFETPAEHGVTQHAFKQEP